MLFFVRWIYRTANITHQSIHQIESTMNKKRKQIILLTVIIILPVFIFAFLQTFGENEFKRLPVMAPEANSGCSQVSATGYTVPDFRVQSANGTPLTQQDLKGEIYVAAFIDTQCTSRECTEVGLSLYRVQERFRREKEVKIVAFTANPEMDSLSVLKAYANRMQADPKQWYFASGSEEELSEIGRCGYGIVKTASLSATSWVALVDGNSQIRGFYDASDREDVNRLLTEATLLRMHTQRRKKGS